MNISHSFVTSRYLYDPKTGRVWSRRLGRTIDAINVDGYCQVTIARKSIKVHRLAVFYMTGAWPKGPVDHINRKRSDNRWKNLRVTTAKENHVDRAPSFGCYKYKGQRAVPKGIKIQKLFRNPELNLKIAA